MTTKPYIPAACPRVGCDGTELSGLPCDSSPDVCAKFRRLALVSRGRAFVENQAKALAGSRQADELRALLLHMDEQADMIKRMTTWARAKKCDTCAMMEIEDMNRRYTHYRGCGSCGENGSNWAPPTAWRG